MENFEFVEDTPTTSEASWSLPTIPEFFRGRNVFVTGGSGFMGKVLLEKLLRSCPEIGHIYVLLRAKRGKDVNQRLGEMIQLPLFDRLREENPSTFMKLVAISGDVSEVGLGMRSEDRRILQETVSVFFHTAASVRFDDSIKKAVIINVRGTQEAIHLALGMKNLKAFVHVSTAYSNCDREPISEKMYPPHGDWKTMIQLAEDEKADQILCSLTPKILSYLPNTYVYAKSLAEHLLKDFEDRLPVVLFRPSIVICSIKEPVPGWVDNFNGPTGLMLACGTGLIRCVYGDPDHVRDYVNVDVSIKAMIVAAWHRAVHSEPVPLPIYNCTTMTPPTTSKELDIMGQEIAKSYPLGQAIWRCGFSFETVWAVFYVKAMLLHMLPALMIDGILKLKGMKPRFTELQRKIYVANVTLARFMFQYTTFKNSNFLDLHSRIRDKDIEDFGFKEINQDRRHLYTVACIGTKKYLLKESMDDLPKAKLLQNRLYWLDIITKTIFYLISLYLVISFARDRFPQDAATWNTFA